MRVRTAYVERGRGARTPEVEPADLRSAPAQDASDAADAGAAPANPSEESAQSNLSPTQVEEARQIDSRVNGPGANTPRANVVALNARPAGTQTLREPQPDQMASDGGVARQGAAPAERPSMPQTAEESESGLAAPDGESAGERVDLSDGVARATKGKNRDVETMEASLYVPRSGMPAPLRGSLASLERQNSRLDAEGLERIEDEADLALRVADKLLVPLPASSALTVNAGLPEAHRYCRPWTARFLADLARAHEAAFRKPIEVNSAVRTVEYQKRLMATNGNAAPAEGDMVSPHLTGATVDIAKEGLSRNEMAWMRRRLAELEAAGKIDVEEEFQQACFHITVYKTYAPARKAGPASQAKKGSAKSGRIATESAAVTDNQGG